MQKKDTTKERSAAKRVRPAPLITPHRIGKLVRIIVPLLDSDHQYTNDQVASALIELVTKVSEAEALQGDDCLALDYVYEVAFNQTRTHLDAMNDFVNAGEVGEYDQTPIGGIDTDERTY